MDQIYLSTANLIVCAAWAWGAFQRLHACHAGVLTRIRLVYASMLVAAFASGFQFQLFGDYAGWSDVITSVSMVGFLWVGGHRWRSGVPHELIKRIGRIV